ncbi:MAG: ankyrin repeat domain-containing protein [Noviherbaspirillum sp.]
MDTVGFLLSRKSGRERAACLCTTGGYFGFNALHLAVLSGDAAKLELILRAHEQARLGKDALNARNSNGKSPLALALEAGQFGMADLLLQKGARPLASE